MKKDLHLVVALTLALVAPIVAGYVNPSTVMTTNTAQTVSALKTVALTAVASTAEGVAQWGTSDDANGKLEVRNAVSTNSSFASHLKGTHTASVANAGLLISSYVASDTVSGTNPVMKFDTRLTSAAAIANRIAYSFESGGVGKVRFSGDGAISPGGVDVTVKWTSGAGSPEGVVTGAIGSLYTRTDGGASTTLYIKESGTGNTGWVAK